MITNYKSKIIDVFNLTEDDIWIQDAMIALPNICRYNGRVHMFYSVAQHAIELSKYLIQIDKEYLVPMALLHDAPEAYIGDLIWPIKNRFPEFIKFEDELSNLFYSKYNVDKSYAEEFDFYDKNIVMNEMVLLGIDKKEKDLTRHLTLLPNFKIDRAISITEARTEYTSWLIKYGIVNVK